MYTIWILIILLLISLSINVLIIKEIYNINEQITFLIKNNTQMRISTGLSIKPFAQFSEVINEFLDSYHSKEKNYINKEK